MEVGQLRGMNAAAKNAGLLGTLNSEQTRRNPPHGRAPPGADSPTRTSHVTTRLYLIYMHLAPGYGRTERGVLADYDGQVFVFHFPGVIQRVKRSVPNQIPERPGAGHFAFRMERTNGVAIGVAVRSQALVR